MQRLRGTHWDKPIKDITKRRKKKLEINSNRHVAKEPKLKCKYFAQGLVKRSPSTFSLICGHVMGKNFLSKSITVIQAGSRRSELLFS